MHDSVVKRFAQIAPAADFCSLRVVEENSERLSVRSGVAEPVALGRDVGAMITVVVDGGLGYAATSDLSQSGLARAAAMAKEWAEKSRGRLVGADALRDFSHATGTYSSPCKSAWSETSSKDKLARLTKASAVKGPRIVDTSASLWFTEVNSRLVTTEGGDAVQSLSLMVPGLRFIANEGSNTQVRSLGQDGRCQQGGYEVLDHIGFDDAGVQLAAEAQALLDAEDCPVGRMDVLLHPDQMVLQIHESIGHPLEIDRILGDERNYAGTSFVTPDMFGSYQYGSELLNVTYDPGVEGQFASFAFDDEGAKAERVHLIENGILKKAIGGATSQRRSGLPGNASSRASTWNRPPIDRMSNLNVEAGQSSFDELVASVERGVFMKTNLSWSIDDSRNKFQFGCQWAQLIEDGKLTRLVRNPNYRGISAKFWRSLRGLGNDATVRVLGEPYCGKGEPNQLIRVGHASPMCLFADIEVFGGES